MANPTETPKHALAHAMMNRNGFNYEKKRRALIWAAKTQKCPDCGQEPYEPCLHLGELKTKAREHVKINRQPHEKRIDWDRLLEALKQIGYR